MEVRSRKLTPRKMIGCIGIPALVVLALCGGPEACSFIHEQGVKREFRAHRAFYENLVREIERDIPENSTRMYMLAADRYAGSLKTLRNGRIDESHDGFSGRAVIADKWRGVLTVRVALRMVKGLYYPSECGVVFCSSGVPFEQGEERLTKFEDRWWLRWNYLGK